MSTATKLENISALRGDTKGILDNIANPLASDESVDKKGDSDKFIIKTQRDGTHDWIPETNENITIENESSLFGESLLNRYFTPTRMLLRHGNVISSGMSKADAQASVLKFQKTDKSNSLETTGDGLTGLKESDDIAVSSLTAPIFKPIKHTIECLFTLTDLEVFSANPNGYVTFSETISGYVLSLKKKNNEDKAEITIIEKGTSSEVPVDTLPAPVALPATEVSTVSFTSNWEVVTRALTYEIEYSITPDFTGETTIRGGITTLNDLLEGEFSSDQPYYYRIRAHNATLTSGWSNIIRVDFPYTGDGALYNWYTAKGII
jgi:hypothetical protein